MTSFVSGILPALALWLAAGVVAAEAPATYKPPTPGAEVVELRMTWKDAARQREVPVKIYHPKTGAGPFPVILFSHGLGGSKENYAYLGRHWAGCGYVSVHLQHAGSDEAVWKDVPMAQRARALQQSAMNLGNAMDRPKDVSFVLDQLERQQADSASPLHGKLKLAAVGMAGHSFGGYTTLAAAGQTFAGALGRGMNLGDPRIKAAIQMSAPVPLIRRNLDTVYGSITIPVMHMTGTEDFVEILPQTKPEDRRLPYDHMKHSDTCLVIFNKGDHMIFSGRERAADPAKIAQDQVFHRLICAGTTAFWDAWLKKLPAAGPWLYGSGYTGLLGDKATFEHKRP